MRESEVERQFVEAVRAAGGQALKFTSQSMNGVYRTAGSAAGRKVRFCGAESPRQADASAAAQTQAAA